MVKAGDLAPEILVTKIIRSPDNTVWKHTNLQERLTVLLLFPNLADTTEAFFSLWNGLVERFADSRAQFVLIARSREPDLELWLSGRTFEGWLLLDANWETARNWGMEMPQVAFIDANTRILGFSRHTLPSASEIEQILAGNVAKARLDVKPQSPGGDKPDVPPSYRVHISPSRREPEDGTHGSAGPDHWTRLGFELRAVIGEVYGIQESRIDFPPSLDNGDRYDFELLLPREENAEVMIELTKKAIQEYFHLHITYVTRTDDVYVFTAPEGKGPALKDSESSGGFLSWGSTWTPRNPDEAAPSVMPDLRRTPLVIANLSASGMAIADLCRAVEPNVGRLVVDETGLEGAYDFQVINSGDNTEDFLAALRDQLGIVATPGRREVTMLSVSHS
jgi:uncharacterized protein (TIGR03435 family)